MLAYVMGTKFESFVHFNNILYKQESALFATTKPDRLLIHYEQHWLFLIVFHCFVDVVYLTQPNLLRCEILAAGSEPMHSSGLELGAGELLQVYRRLRLHLPA
jgi:hypothetical protein